MTLLLDWATPEGAELACRNWHYAGVPPTGDLVKVGVWEHLDFQGVVIFSRGASPYLGRKYGLDQIEVCELTRVALRAHDAPVSKILSIATKMLKRSNPGIRMIVSFADPTRDHHGGVYQAANWIYTGMSDETIEYLIDGEWRHKRGVYYGLRDSGEIEQTEQRVQPGKHRYLYALDAELRELCELNRLPYPKSVRAYRVAERSSLPEGPRHSSRE